MLDLNYLSAWGLSLSPKISQSHLIPSGHCCTWPLARTSQPPFPSGKQGLCLNWQWKGSACTQVQGACTQEKLQCEGWENHRKDYLSLLMFMRHWLAEPSSDGSLGWVQWLCPKWDCLCLSGWAWPNCLRTSRGRGSCLGALVQLLGACNCWNKDMEFWQSRFWTPVLFSRGLWCLLQAALAHQFLPQFPC